MEHAKDRQLFDYFPGNYSSLPFSLSLSPFSFPVSSSSILFKHHSSRIKGNIIFDNHDIENPLLEVIELIEIWFQARLEIRLKRWRARGRKKLRSRWTARGPRSDRTSPPNWAVCSPDFPVWRVPNASPLPSGRNSPITPVSLRIFPFLVHATSSWRPSLTIVDEVNGVVPARRPVIVN